MKSIARVILNRKRRAAFFFYLFETKNWKFWRRDVFFILFKKITVRYQSQWRAFTAPLIKKERKNERTRSLQRACAVRDCRCLVFLIFPSPPKNFLHFHVKLLFVIFAIYHKKFFFSLILFEPRCLWRGLPFFKIPPPSFFLSIRFGLRQ